MQSRRAAEAAPAPVKPAPLTRLPQVLRNKAALRNPDEFYFAMEKARTKEGVHLARCLPRAPPPSLRCSPPTLCQLHAADAHRRRDALDEGAPRRASPDSSLSSDLHARLQTQDAGYVQLKAQAEAKASPHRCTRHSLSLKSARRKWSAWRRRWRCALC